jgi:hypothetical protein
MGQGWQATNWRAAIACAVVFVIGGCSSPSPPEPQPAGPGWQRVTLPVAGNGRPELKDLATCPGHWYAVGGYLGADGNTSPAAWTSVDDGRTWSALATAPVSVYGPQHVLLAVACRGDSMVAVGAVSGGAHGNLRTGTWRRTGTGPLTEVPPPSSSTVARTRSAWTG